jgi:hypothetical protein
MRDSTDLTDAPEATEEAEGEGEDWRWKIIGRLFDFLLRDSLAEGIAREGKRVGRSDLVASPKEKELWK